MKKMIDFISIYYLVYFILDCLFYFSSFTGKFPWTMLLLYSDRKILIYFSFRTCKQHRRRYFLFRVVDENVVVDDDESMVTVIIIITILIFVSVPSFSDPLQLFESSISSSTSSFPAFLCCYVIVTSTIIINICAIMIPIPVFSCW